MLIKASMRDVFDFTPFLLLFVHRLPVYRTNITVNETFCGMSWADPVPVHVHRCFRSREWLDPCALFVGDDGRVANLLV